MDPLDAANFAHSIDQFSSNLSINNDSGSTPVVSTPCVQSSREDTEVSPLPKYLALLLLLDPRQLHYVLVC